MQAVILAAGRGTRLSPITDTRTKAMCPVAGKPMVERVMDTLVASGISDFILVISPDDPDIIGYFDHTSKIRARIQFVTQEKQLGMGHALLQAAPFINDDFILSSCDNLVENKAIIRMLTLWAGYPPPNGILALLRVGPEELTRMGVVEMDEDNHIIQIVEKPTLEEAPSNIGSVPIYLFSPKLVDYLGKIQPSPRGEYELQDAMQELIEKDGDVYGLLLPKRIDLTHPQDLLRLNLYFLERQNTKNEIDTEYSGNGTRFINPVIVENGVTIGDNCQIGPNVFIESGAILGDDVWLENCVVLRDQKVPAQARLKDKLVFK
jgi:bifunctional UDP-N-acetylglucosamine pyrophosphorylase/glucosamine-1-phosphate N-acetyltransferase